GFVALRRFMRRPAAVTALVVVVALFVAGALAGVLAPGGWDQIDLNAVHRGPTFAGGHLFGTDWVGRDMVVRTLYGVRTTAGVARIIRADVARLRAQDFVEAGRAVGASDLRLLRRHVLPNIGGTIAVAATALVGQIVLIDATVEFFGYGLPESIAPSLGNLVA